MQKRQFKKIYKKHLCMIYAVKYYKFKCNINKLNQFHSSCINLSKKKNNYWYKVATTE